MYLINLLYVTMNGKLFSVQFIDFKKPYKLNACKSLRKLLQIKFPL